MTPPRRIGVIGGVMVLCLTGLAADAYGQMYISTGRDTLRGLPGVEVLVEGLQPELERSGLTGAAIRADVEQRLRARGISVYASQADNPSPAKPYLYVHINALPLQRPEGYAIAVQLQLRQTLRSLVTSSNIVNAMTWDTHNVLGVPTPNLQSVQAEVRDYVDRFIKDWLAVH